jgi:hypothetical protein
MFRRPKHPIAGSGEPVKRRAFVAMAAGAVAAAMLRARTAQGQRSPVRVTREEPVILRVEFDPRAPPYGMPPLTPPEAGICRTTFELDAGVTYSSLRLSRTAARITVDGLDIVTRVRFDIFTAQNTPAKLLAHEEGHRAIGEHYYEDAAAIADEIGRRLIGKTFDGVGADQEAARRDAFNQVVASIESDYMARTRTPSAAANERFDEITRHGLADIDEAEAVALAIAGAAR